jgi:hypothetical protein
LNCFARFPCGGAIYGYKLIVIYMKKMGVACVRRVSSQQRITAVRTLGTCQQHQSAFADAPRVDELLVHLEKDAGISSEFLGVAILANKLLDEGDD